MPVPARPVTWSPEILEFARRVGLAPHLDALVEATHRTFPTLRKLDVTLECDPEIVNDWYLVFEVEVPSADVPDFVKAKRAWDDAMVAVTTHPPRQFYRLALLPVDKEACATSCKRERLLRIGLDLDGLLDELPELFAFLTRALRGGGHYVAILTYRDPASRTRTEAQLAALGIVYDELHFARSLDDKGRLCRELAIDVYFDDQDECLVGIDESTVVFKVRNGGNFDFRERKWLSTARLTRLL
jgi:hypothetical protein